MKIRFHWVRLLSPVVIFAWLACGLSSGLQLTLRVVDQQQASDAKEFQTAANRWMKTPVEAVSSQTDSISSGDRQARDAYWDKRIGASMPLSDPTARLQQQPMADPDPWAPELGDLGQGVLVLGKFESYRTVLSKSRRSLYTEIQFRVQHVFGHPNAPAQAGELIDIDRAGGTIIAPWGGTLSVGLRPEQMGLQPGHAYLIRLGYDPSGNCYLAASITTIQLWDLTDGIVKPGNSLQKYRAESGRSEINGLSIDALIRLLDKKFEDYYTGKK
ncbi:MAG TPA: hypothetical protein VIB39_10435 [Candidatus Angelobacter sp.]|jgi:hypothetical protein